MSAPKTEQVRVSVTTAMRREVLREAVRLDVSEAQIIRQAIRNYLKERRK